MQPFLALGLSGVFAAAGSILLQLSQEPGWAETGALGLLGTSSVLLVLAVIRGDLLHTKSAEREEALRELVKTVHDMADRAHAREQVHEKFMTAAIDRIVQSDRDARDA